MAALQPPRGFRHRAWCSDHVRAPPVSALAPKHGRWSRAETFAGRRQWSPRFSAAAVAVVAAAVAAPAWGGTPTVRPSVAAEAARLSALSPKGCGACVAAGGAWCLEGGRCVPDARGMCGVADGGGGRQANPAMHVGMAGTGRCPDARDFELQAYYLAPRRPPVEPSPTLTSTSCDDACAPGSLRSAGDGAAALGALEARFHDCGVAVIEPGGNGTGSDGVGDAADGLAALRETVVSKLGLAATAEAAAKGRAAKYLVPGVRGNARGEFVLPATADLVGAVRRHVLTPRVVSALERLLGHKLAVEFASVMVSWPGAAAQSYHRDADAGKEAALLVFAPLEPMRADEGGNGPPELCLCTHHPRGGGPEAECPGGRVVVDEGTVPLGAVLAYDAGLVHRGLSNRAAGRGFSRARPRVMLHLVIAPAGVPLRARPHGFLSPVARDHVRRWRALDIGGGGGGSSGGGNSGGSSGGGSDQAPDCSTRTPHGCQACVEAGRGGGKPWRTGCAWCVETSKCVPDVAGVCPGGPRRHVGASGLAPSCPDDDARSDL